jgi:hypothetical protein
MATCAINKIDSNVTGLSYAEEECLKQLPGVEGADAVWKQLEVNSYSDFGGEIATVAASPISRSRQNQKGTVTDLDASGGANLDFKLTNLVDILQGFFFADVHEPATTKPNNGTSVAITGVVAGTKTYSAAAGLAIFAADDLAIASGFGPVSNNGLRTIATAAAGAVTVVETVVDEAAPSVDARLDRVGYQFAAADIAVAVVGGIPSLVATAGDFTTKTDLYPGQWIFIGGDNAANRFVNNVGYARIASIAAKSLTFDETTWTPVNEAGTGITLRIFVPLSLHNEKDPALIKRRSYNIERTLGEGANSTQAEYLEGAVPNEFTLNIPQADKINADLSFIACDNTQRSGDVGDLIKAGTREVWKPESIYNTSSNIYRMKLSVIDPTSSNPQSLFGFATELTVTINNNVTPAKAIGTLGAFDVNVGNFEVGGSVNAYFSTVEAVRAVRNNADVGLSIITASKNSGFIFDIPLLGLGGGRVTVEKDNPVMLPLESNGAESKFGYTLYYAVFKYLPSLAMPL